MNADKILEIAKEIKYSSKADKVKYFSHKYSEFSKTYPVLFKICCDDKNDMAQLEFMINMLKDIQQNKITEHVASANVGQKLYDSYVKPVIAEPDN